LIELCHIICKFKFRFKNFTQIYKIFLGAARYSEEDDDFGQRHKIVGGSGAGREEIPYQAVLLHVYPDNEYPNRSP